MSKSDKQISLDRKKLVKPEYWLIGFLLLIGAISVPAMQNVYLLQSFVLSICTGLGL